MKEEMTMTAEKKIQQILDESINKQLELHGGSAVFTGYEDGTAWIKLNGACASCMSASDTFENVIKAGIMEALPEVKDVKLDDTVSEDLMEMARKILGGQLK